MAGDWIKMRTDLYRDPKVIAMADRLLMEDGDLAAFVSQNCQRYMTVTRNVTRNAVVGALVSVWGVARHQGKRIGDDLWIHNCTAAVLDDIADLPGFGEAMEAVQWVVVDGDSLCFPRFFDEHNSDPGDRKQQQNRERQRRYRERMSNAESNVTRNVTVTPREEKRREESITTLTSSNTAAKSKRPTVEEVRAYCEERGNRVDPQAWFDHYQSNGWMVGKVPMKDWKAAVRTWERSSFPRKTPQDELAGYLASE